MLKIHKNRNPNHTKSAILLAADILIALIVVGIAVILALQFNRSREFLHVFIVILLVLLGALILVSRQYSILIAGARGERAMLKIIRKLKIDGTVFTNLPIKHKNRRSEIDMLLITKNGVMLVEVKNVSGTITGTDKQKRWTQTKTLRGGKQKTKQMDNAFFQIKRQRDILKNILRDNDIDLWIENVLYFTNSRANVKLKVSENNYIAKTPDDIRELLLAQNHKLSKEEMIRIEKVLSTGNLA